MNSLSGGLVLVAVLCLQPAADAQLDAILQKAGSYVVAYAKDLSAVVAEERYEQRLVLVRALGRDTGDERLTQRVTRSDFLLVRVPGEDRWLPFRDVFEVDGVPVRDRDERLQKLFLEAPAMVETRTSALAQAARINDESARYNLGGIVRTINLPVLPLRFLEAANVSRFAFTRHGQDTVEGNDTWRVDCRETSRPTLIKSSRGRDARDVPASGSFWIDPATGRVVKTHLRLQTEKATMDTTVIYRPAGNVGVWVPSEMRERYEYGGGTISATATYSNFRRFQVTTEERVKVK